MDLRQVVRRVEMIRRHELQHRRRPLELDLHRHDLRTRPVSRHHRLQLGTEDHEPRLARPPIRMARVAEPNAERGIRQDAMRGLVVRPAHDTSTAPPPTPPAPRAPDTRDTRPVNGAEQAPMAAPRATNTRHAPNEEERPPPPRPVAARSAYRSVSPPKNDIRHPPNGCTGSRREWIQPISRKNAVKSPATAAGSSTGAKCPPRGNTVHRRTLYKRSIYDRGGSPSGTVSCANTPNAVGVLT